jgi:hypothetical protein
MIVKHQVRTRIPHRFHPGGHRMLDLLFSEHAAWFGVPAVLGTVFFTLRLVIMLVGGDIGHGDFDAHGAELHHGDPAEAFKILSVQSIAAFFMGFGWGGLGALRGSDLSWPASILIALGCGLGMMWLLGMMLRGLMAMQSSGNISLNDAIGGEGEVYVTIPAAAGAGGQVKMVINGRQRIINAISQADALPPHARVRIIRINEDNTVTVAPV